VTYFDKHRGVSTEVKRTVCSCQSSNLVILASVLVDSDPYAPYWWEVQQRKKQTKWLLQSVSSGCNEGHDGSVDSPCLPRVLVVPEVLVSPVDPVQ